MKIETHILDKLAHLLALALPLTPEDKVSARGNEPPIDQRESSRKRAREEMDEEEEEACEGAMAPPITPSWTSPGHEAKSARSSATGEEGKSSGSKSRASSQEIDL